MFSTRTSTHTHLNPTVQVDKMNTTRKTLTVFHSLLIPISLFFLASHSTARRGLLPPQTSFLTTTTPTDHEPLQITPPPTPHLPMLRELKQRDETPPPSIAPNLKPAVASTFTKRVPRPPQPTDATAAATAVIETEPVTCSINRQTCARATATTVDQHTPVPIGGQPRRGHQAASYPGAPEPRTVSTNRIYHRCLRPPAPRPAPGEGVAVSTRSSRLPPSLRTRPVEPTVAVS